MLGLHPKKAGAPQQSQVKEAQGNALRGAVLFSPQLSRLDAAKVLTSCLLLLPTSLDPALLSVLSPSLAVFKSVYFLIWGSRN